MTAPPRDKIELPPGYGIARRFHLGTTAETFCWVRGLSAGHAYHHDYAEGPGRWNEAEAARDAWRDYNERQGERQ